MTDFFEEDEDPAAVFARVDAAPKSRTAAPVLDREPPTGSVVAIDWGGQHQEVWVSNRANIGNWYTPDAVLSNPHPTWGDVRERARGRSLTLLVPADADALATGYNSGVSQVADAVAEVIDSMRVYSTGSYPEAGTEVLARKKLTEADAAEIRRVLDAAFPQEGGGNG